MALEEFSGGYYKADMNIQAYSGGPVIENGLYEFINREIYTQTNAPVTFKVGLDKGPYFSVKAESAVPTNVLALPREWMDDMMVESGTHAVFVLKPAHSYVLNQSVRQRDRFDSHNVNN